MLFIKCNQSEYKPCVFINSAAKYCIFQVQRTKLPAFTLNAVLPGSVRADVAEEPVGLKCALLRAQTLISWTLPDSQGK